MDVLVILDVLTYLDPDDDDDDDDDDDGDSIF